MYTDLSTNVIISEEHKRRRQEVIDYIKKHPECNKQDVINYCTKKGIGTRVPIRNIIDDLEEEGIIKKEKRKKNSRSFKLTLNSENILAIVPQDLEQIFTQFKHFVKAVKKLCKERPEIYHKPMNPLQTVKINLDSIWNLAPSLPYHLIDLINDIYQFYFIFILPNKLGRQNIIMTLYSSYFETLSKMYFHVSKELSDNIPSYDISLIKDSNLYKSYIESKKETIFGKVYSLVKTCRILNIEEELFETLDLLWIKNIDVIILLYNIKFHPLFYTAYQQKLQIKYNDFINNNETLKKIHLCIDNFIFMLEGSSQQDSAFIDFENTSK